MSSQSPEDDQTSSQVRDNEHDALVALLDKFHADNTKKRRLKLEGIVSHGQKLSKEYQADVKKVLEQADAEIDKRIAAFQKEEALRIDQTRELESQLLALLEKKLRQKSVETAAETIDCEIADYVEASDQLTQEIEAIADNEMVYFTKQRELLFSPPAAGEDNNEAGPSTSHQERQQQQPQQEGDSTTTGAVAGPSSSDDQFEYADPPAARPRAHRPAAAAAGGVKIQSVGMSSKAQQTGGAMSAQSAPGGGGGQEGEQAVGAVPMQVDPRA